VFQLALMVITDWTAPIPAVAATVPSATTWPGTVRAPLDGWGTIATNVSCLKIVQLKFWPKRFFD